MLVTGGTVTAEAELFEQARVLHEQAVFGGDVGALATADHVLDAAEAALSVARGRILHARFVSEHREDPHELALFERAAALFHQPGDVRGEAEAAFWGGGTFHHVVHGDNDAARPELERSRKLATASR